MFLLAMREQKTCERISTLGCSALDIFTYSMTKLLVVFSSEPITIADAIVFEKYSATKVSTRHMSRYDKKSKAKIHVAKQLRLIT